MYLKLENVTKIYDNGFQAVKNVSISIDKGDFLVLVGPSGCAKSTILRMIAGLESVSEGNIYIDGKLVNDAMPKDRDIAMVFQDYALYPHMSVFDNISFGLQLKKTNPEIIKKAVLRVAKNLEIENLLDSKPKQLSGGQRQRVALARSLIKNPKLFLLDEPLSNLDAKLRVSTRAKISEIHRENQATMVYVTHDQVEAMTMGNKVCVINKGEVMQIGDPLDLYNYPANKFVASFMGSPAMNILHGSIVMHNGEPYFAIDSQPIVCCSKYQHELTKYIQQDIYLGIRPSKISLSMSNLQAEHAVLSNNPFINEIKVLIILIERTGSQVFLHVQFYGQNLIAKIQVKDTNGLAVGQNINIYIDIHDIYFFDYITENNITLKR